MKPQEPIPHNYSIRSLNWIFALSSLALLLVTGIMVGYDYIRGWKWFQREFMRMQRERIESDIKTADTAANKKQLAELDEKIKTSEVEIARNRQQYLLAQKDLDTWEGKHYAADQDYRFAKANLDAQRYVAEASVVQHREDADAQQAEYRRQDKHVNDLLLRLQDVTRSRDAAKARVDEWLKHVKEAEDRKKELNASVDLYKKQLELVNLKAGSPNWILNLPMLDFVNPTLKIDQVVLPDLFVDVNYMHVPRVDRCQTCHRSIDTPGFESKKEAARLSQEIQQKLDGGLIPPDKRPDAEKQLAQLDRIQKAPYDTLNPWRTHPRLETFVGSASPHPLLEFGCTACHRGQDRATEFGRAGHTPPNPKMQRRWAGVSMATLGFFPTPGDFEKRNWGWAPNPFLETPMYPRQYYEAGCIKCHRWDPLESTCRHASLSIL